MRCIFCLEDRPDGWEHVFPEAIGGTLTTTRVCTDCNSTLGSQVDAKLTGFPTVVMRRWELKLPGYSGKVPDPLNWLGTGILASDPTQKIKASVNPSNGKADIELVTNKKILADGTIQFAIDRRNFTEIPLIIQRTRVRAGLPPLDAADLSQAVRAVEADCQTSENPDVLHTISSEPCQRPLLKIAYELAFQWLGEDYLHDEMAARLREAIMGRAGLESTRMQQYTGSEHPPFRFWAEDNNAHIAYTSVQEDDVIVYLRIFDVLSAAVVVSEGRSRYVRGPLDAAHVRFLHLDPMLKTKRESSLIEESGRIAQVILESGLPASP
jgi:hypothetical protein